MNIQLGPIKAGKRRRKKNKYSEAQMTQRVTTMYEQKSVNTVRLTFYKSTSFPETKMQKEFTGKGYNFSIAAYLLRLEYKHAHILHSEYV